MKRNRLSLVCCLVLASIGCEVGPQSGVGLRLPNGDVVKGKQAFEDLGCIGCHEVGDRNATRTGADGQVIVVLGGKVPHIETHGELVTSIVNPSHGFPRHYPREQVMDEDRSRMVNFNETMTVEQLIDLTTYLQSKYELDLQGLYAP